MVPSSPVVASPAPKRLEERCTPLSQRSPMKVVGRLVSGVVRLASIGLRSQVPAEQMVSAEPVAASDLPLPS